MLKYTKMLETSREIYEFVYNGGRKLKDGLSIKAVKEAEAHQKNQRPAWKQTGTSNMPITSKPQKSLFPTQNIQAKVKTGLNQTFSFKNAKQSTQT